MFLFRDVIEQLQDAEVSLISLTDKKTGEIPASNYNKVINFLNTALSDLYTRFDLVRGECVIQTKEGKYSYEIKKGNSVTQDPINGFIVDSAEDPFDFTVLELTGVYTMLNHALPFNQVENFDYAHLQQQQTFTADECTKLFSSPKFGVLRTPVGLKDSALKVRFKAGHKLIPRIPKLELETFDTESLVIDLPYPFLMAVVFFIASRANSGRGTERAGQSVMNESGSMFSRYLSECKAIQGAMAMTTETSKPVDTFIQRGFI